MAIFDRLLGRTAEPAPEAKAVVTGNGGSGAGVVALTYDIPLDNLSRNPQKLAAAAQRAYHENVWVHAAEWAVVSRAASVDWHLEDDEGNTIGDQPDEAHPALDLLLNPAPEQFGKVPSIARRRLKTLTLRHMGLVGYTFWYLDQRDALAGTPRQLLYINPARMMPATDRGGNLIGWIMDGDRPNGRQPVAFELDEILPFILDPDDDGWLGIGLVESAYTKIRLSKHGDVHATKSLGAGGRKPGIMMPTADKGAFTQTEYDDIVRQMRTVTDSPDATKKSLIFKVPVDYRDAGVTPEQMQLDQTLKGARDDIFAAWGVPIAQVGIPTARGLNGGDAYKGDEAILWQGPIKSRLDVYEETVQTGLLDRYAVLGRPIHLKLHQPTFDDKAPQYDLVQKSQTLPMTRDERRALVGLPPLGAAFGGNIIDLPTTITMVGTGPDEAGAEIEEGGEVAKARFDPHEELLGLRRQTAVTWEPRLKKQAAALLSEMRDAIAERAQARHAHLVAKPKDTAAVFDEAEWVDRFAAMVKAEQELAQETSTKIDRALKREGKAGFLDAVLEFVQLRGAERVKGIVSTTRDLLSELIGKGIADGLSPADLGKSIRESTAFDEARAEMIARTETAYAYNDAATRTYRDLQVQHVEVIDGDQDDICATANGQTWTLEQSESNPLGHPNCTRDFIPLLS